MIQTVLLTRVCVRFPLWNNPNIPKSLKKRIHHSLFSLLNMLHHVSILWEIYPNITQQSNLVQIQHLCIIYFNLILCNSILIQKKKKKKNIYLIKSWLYYLKTIQSRKTITSFMSKCALTEFSVPGSACSLRGNPAILKKHFGWCNVKAKIRNTYKYANILTIYSLYTPYAVLDNNCRIIVGWANIYPH